MPLAARMCETVASGGFFIPTMVQGMYRLRESTSIVNSARYSGIIIYAKGPANTEAFIVKLKRKQTSFFYLNFILMSSRSCHTADSETT